MVGWLGYLKWRKRVLRALPLSTMHENALLSMTLLVLDVSSPANARLVHVEIDEGRPFGEFYVPSFLVPSLGVPPFPRTSRIARTCQARDAIMEEEGTEGGHEEGGHEDMPPSPPPAPVSLAVMLMLAHSLARLGVDERSSEWGSRGPGDLASTARGIGRVIIGVIWDLVQAGKGIHKKKGDRGYSMECVRVGRAKDTDKTLTYEAFPVPPLGD